MSQTEQRYRIIEKLDAGGMAEIYRGEVESIQGFKKQIAIKRILPNLTRNEKFVAMFLDEARLSLYLNHANIVQVFDIGRSGSTYFIVMEFVDGLNLRALTQSLKRQNRRLAVAHAIFIMMEVLKGLSYAHEIRDPDSGKPLGIVHRDISPPNILLSRMGEVKLVDFGLAKAASQLEQTEPGVVKGKFSYLSPEAATSGPVDHRADIFAAGIIFFEMLTGRRLFYGETDYQTVELVRQARVPPMNALNHDVSPELERIVQKCLARDPGQRYQHADEVLDVLAHYLFSRGLKVTNRDVGRLVRSCLVEHRQTIPPAVKSDNVIDALIQEEVLKFTSVEATEEGDNVGAQPLLPGSLTGENAPLDPADMVDTRGWMSELDDMERDGSLLTFSKPGEPAQVEDFPSLEGILDDNDDAISGEAAPPETPQEPGAAGRRGRGLARGLVIALVVLLVLGGATAFVLHTLGVVSTGGPDDNRDLVQPE